MEKETNRENTSTENAPKPKPPKTHVYVPPTKKDN